jgi:hypothetical protein
MHLLGALTGADSEELIGALRNKKGKRVRVLVLVAFCVIIFFAAYYQFDKLYFDDIDKIIAGSSSTQTNRTINDVKDLFGRPVVMMQMLRAARATKQLTLVGGTRASPSAWGSYDPAPFDAQFGAVQTTFGGTYRSVTPQSVYMGLDWTSTGLYTAVTRSKKTAAGGAGPGAEATTRTGLHVQSTDPSSQELVSNDPLRSGARVTSMPMIRSGTITNTGVQGREVTGVLVRDETRAVDGSSSYDPRERPWYVKQGKKDEAKLAAAVARGGVASVYAPEEKTWTWTEPYIFSDGSSSGLVGITLTDGFIFTVKADEKRAEAAWKEYRAATELSGTGPVGTVFGGKNRIDVRHNTTTRFGAFAIDLTMDVIEKRLADSITLYDTKAGDNTTTTDDQNNINAAKTAATAATAVAAAAAAAADPGNTALATAAAVAAKSAADARVAKVASTASSSAYNSGISSTEDDIRSLPAAPGYKLGIVFIIDRNGFMIASSEASSEIARTNDCGKVVRVSASNASVVGVTTAFIWEEINKKNALGNLRMTESNNGMRSISFKSNKVPFQLDAEKSNVIADAGQVFKVTVAPLDLDNGISWYTVVALRENMFTGDFRADSNVALLTICVIIGVVTLASSPALGLLATVGAKKDLVEAQEELSSRLNEVFKLKPDSEEFFQIFLRLLMSSVLAANLAQRLANKDEMQPSNLLKQVRVMFHQQKKEARALFNRLDEDGSGSVSRREFCAVATQLGFSGSQGELDNMFDAFDRDGNGQLTYAELLGEEEDGMTRTESHSNWMWTGGEGKTGGKAGKGADGGDGGAGGGEEDAGSDNSSVMSEEEEDKGDDAGEETVATWHERQRALGYIIDTYAGRNLLDMLRYQRQKSYFRKRFYLVHTSRAYSLCLAMIFACFLLVAVFEAPGGRYGMRPRYNNTENCPDMPTYVYICVYMCRGYIILHSQERELSRRA